MAPNLPIFQSGIIDACPLFLKPVTISPMYCDLELDWTVEKKARRSLYTVGTAKYGQGTEPAPDKVDWESD